MRTRKLVDYVLQRCSWIKMGTHSANKGVCFWDQFFGNSFWEQCFGNSFWEQCFGTNTLGLWDKVVFLKALL